MLILIVLLGSSVAGRQLFADGTTDVVQSMLDPGWFPENQQTPRRAFALLWITLPPRIVGIVSENNINVAAFLFGLASYLQIAIPLIILLRSKLVAPIKSLFVVLFVSATIFLANFASSELLFALALTTLFTIFTLDKNQDTNYWKRYVCAGLLIASYEVVAISNVLLALATFYSVEDGKRRFLIAILLAALPFQVICFFSEPTTPGHDVLNVFDLEITGIALIGVLSALLSTKWLVRWSPSTVLLMAACLFIPLLMIALPSEF